MQVACRLYGHSWTHPGPFEVVIDGNGDHHVPFTCATCAAEMQHPIECRQPGQLDP